MSTDPGLDPQFLAGLQDMTPGDAQATVVVVDPATGQWWLCRRALDQMRERQAAVERPPAPPSPSPPLPKPAPEPAPVPAPEPLTYEQAYREAVRTGSQADLQALMATVTESGADLVQADMDAYLAQPAPGPAPVQAASRPESRWARVFYIAYICTGIALGLYLIFTAVLAYPG